MESSSTHSMSQSVSEFDTTVIITIVTLIAAIVVIMLLGDHVGIQIARVAPIELAHSTEPIVIQFSETMNKDSVIEGFGINPEVEGEFSWNADALFFRPNQALAYGETYTVTVAAGAESQNGRRLLDDYNFAFTVRYPRIAYLYPANDAPQNIFIMDVNNPSDTRQVTFSTAGIVDFAPSPDGKQIAYSEHDSENSDINIHLLTLETGETHQITSCEDGHCWTPVWKPDGTAIAYHRLEANSFLPGAGPSSTYVWLVEFNNTSFDNRPLFEDFQLAAYTPHWSADGNRIAVFDPTAPGTVVYDLTDETTFFVPSYSGRMGALAPNGNQLAYVQRDLEAATATVFHLQLANLATKEVINLTEPDNLIEDTYPVWHPNGRDIVFARHYKDDRSILGTQLYMVNIDTGDIRPISPDSRYANNYFSWDPTGTLMSMQRFLFFDEQGQRNLASVSEAWVYNLATDELSQVVSNAFLPQWLP